MTDEPSDGVAVASAQAPVVGEFLALWAAGIGEVLSKIAGSHFAVEGLPNTPPDAAPPSEGDSQFTINVAGGLRGEMGLRLPPPVVLALAQLLLGEPQESAAELKPDHREAAIELLRQIAGQVATALKPRWGEVQLRVETAAPSWPAGATGWLASQTETPCRVGMEWQLNVDLIAALTATAPEQPSLSTEPSSAGLAAAQPFLQPGNLDLLMDVELEVVLRFGERNMRLEEILELGAGSVVELDRRIEEPADLLLDGRVIARGEVVVVDGNYGLRVLEIGPAPRINPTTGT